MYFQDKTLENKIYGAKFLGWTRIDPFTIQLTTDRGNINVNVCGDCCSHSIFYDVVVPEECFGAKITAVDAWERDNPTPPVDLVLEKAEHIDEGNWDGHHEDLSIWDVKFKTTNGTIYLRHVNSSNGYYDGNVSIDCDY